MAIYDNKQDKCFFDEQEAAVLEYFDTTSNIEKYFFELVKKCMINKGTKAFHEVAWDLRNAYDYLFCDARQIHFHGPFVKLLNLPHISGRKEQSELVRKSFKLGGPVMKLLVFEALWSYELRNDSDYKLYLFTYNRTEILRPKMDESHLMKEKWNSYVRMVNGVSKETKEHFLYDIEETPAVDAPAVVAVIDNAIPIPDEHPTEDAEEDQELIIQKPVTEIFSTAKNTDEEIQAFKHAMDHDVDVTVAEPVVTETKVVDSKPNDKQLKDAVVIEAEPATETAEAEEVTPADEEPVATVVENEFMPFAEQYNQYAQLNAIAEQNYPGLSKLTSILNSENIYVGYTQNQMFPGYIFGMSYAYDKMGMIKQLANFMVFPKSQSGFGYRFVTYNRQDGNLFKETYIPITGQYKECIIGYVKRKGILGKEARAEVNKECRCWNKLISKVDLSLLGQMEIDRASYYATIFGIDNILKNKNLPNVRWRVGRWVSRNEWTLITDKYVSIPFAYKFSDAEVKSQQYYTAMNLRIDFNPEVYEDYGYYVSANGVSPTKENYADLAHMMGFETFAGIPKLKKEEAKVEPVKSNATDVATGTPVVAEEVKPEDQTTMAEVTKAEDIKAEEVIPTKPKKSKKGANVDAMKNLLDKAKKIPENVIKNAPAAQPATEATATA